MASVFTSLKCTSCAGGLEYDRTKKVWVCQYCGAEIVREERSEGPYFIKSVAVRALADAAEEKLDSAQKNVEECEKLDAKYVGTIIARICCNMLCLTTPGACAAGGERALFAQLKRDYAALKELDDSVSPEEEALYEAVGGRSDVFAVLMLAFDSLGALEHRDFVMQFISPAEISSRSLNGKLLGYAIKNGRAEMLEEVMSNLKCLDRREAFFTVLSAQPDGEAKRRFVASLLAGERLLPDDRISIGKYISESADGAATKFAVFSATADAGAAPSVEKMTAALGASDAGSTEVQGFVDALCRNKPNDDELYKFVGSVFTLFGAETAAGVLDRFKANDMFLSISAPMLIKMLARADLSADGKCAVLEAAEQFGIDARGNNAVLTDYLLSGKDAPEARLKVAGKILSFLPAPSADAVESYALKCTLDGDGKAEMMKRLLSSELNPSFVRELPKSYMAGSADTAEIKKQVLDVMTGHGLTLDSNSLIELACGASKDSADETAEFIRQAVSGGARLRSDAMNEYLERTPPERLSSKIVALLHCPGGRLSDEAIAKYVLYCEDDGEIKARNALIFAEQNGKNFGDSECRIRCGGCEVCCSLLQAFLLLGGYGAGDEKLVSLMLSTAGSLDTRITVDGQSVKFRKYVADNRASLSKLSESVCDSKKLFSKLFW